MCCFFTKKKFISRPKIQKFMSEYIVIQVGQCGNQIGSCLLPEILQEYGVKLNNEVNSKLTKRDKIDLQQFMSSFFSFKSRSGTFDTVADLAKSKAKARFLCIDMEDSVVARFKSGAYRDLFDKKCFITNHPGSGNNWAEGYCSHGPKYEQKILKAVQHAVERCDSLHGFLLLFSVGGGTGSGLGSFIVKLLADHYPKIERFVACVYPTGTEDVITCPYNMAFATQELVENATCVFPVENSALLDIVLKRTNRYHRNYGHASMFRPFEDMNSIIVDLVLHLTSGSRFGGDMNIDINDINTNMVPFPKLNFLASGFNPFSFKRSSFTTTGKQPKKEIFISACSRTNQVIRVDPLGVLYRFHHVDPCNNDHIYIHFMLTVLIQDSRYTTMSVTLLGRGNYSVNDMRTYVDILKSKLHFPPWSDKALKIGLCNVAPKGLDYSMFALFNTTSMANLFQEILRQFTKLYQRKAYAHHYTAISGFNCDHFQDCQNSLNDIIQFYKDIEKTKTAQQP